MSEFLPRPDRSEEGWTIWRRRFWPGEFFSFGDMGESLACRPKKQFPCARGEKFREISRASQAAARLLLISWNDE